MSRRANNPSTATKENASKPIQFLNRLMMALITVLPLGMGGALLARALFDDSSQIVERTAIALTFIAFGLAVIQMVDSEQDGEEIRKVSAQCDDILNRLEEQEIKLAEIQSSVRRTRAKKWLRRLCRD